VLSKEGKNECTTAKKAGGSSAEYEVKEEKVKNKMIY
jgi:hypothetical protein